MPPASTSTTSPTARRRAEAAPLEAVLFDLDGTLADTAADLTGALNGVLAEIGRPALELERTRPFASRGRGRCFVSASAHRRTMRASRL
ncbi:MAG: hypothetical protein M5U09_17010 [Gammaproteobacteria bacterium]|nr:hypothetical protein [Gammaproteobacteria bacterium]